MTCSPGDGQGAGAKVRASLGVVQDEEGIEEKSGILRGECFSREEKTGAPAAADVEVENFDMYAVW